MNDVKGYRAMSGFDFSILYFVNHGAFMFFAHKVFSDGMKDKAINRWLLLLVSVWLIYLSYNGHNYHWFFIFATVFNMSYSLLFLLAELSLLLLSKK